MLEEHIPDRRRLKTWAGVFAGALTLIATLITIASTVVASDTQAVPAEAAVSSSIYAPPIPIEGDYVPSGWMGDGEFGEAHLQVMGTNSWPAEPTLVRQFTYRGGPRGWGGVYFQHPPNNWGERPGKDLTGATEVKFRARGARGGEVVEFLSGGSSGAFPDTYRVSMGEIALTPAWRTYSIDLRGRDLSNVVGVFAWVASAADNQLPVRFELTDLEVR